MLLLAACVPQKAERTYNRGINIIPLPVSLTEGQGRFALTPDVVFEAAGEAAQVAGYFKTKMAASTGYTFEQQGMPTGTIALEIDTTLQMKNEGYKLDVAPDGVSVKAPSAAGLFYGMQTLMQLFPAEIESSVKVDGVEWSAPAVSITDEPRFGYRAVMLDPARHFLGLEWVKEQIDAMAMFKINTLHFHLTDDQGWRIEIKKYPQLTSVGSVRYGQDGAVYQQGYYTQEELKDLVAYASERFVEIIPEIEVPGHATAALAAFPGLSCSGDPYQVSNIWGVHDNLFCAGRDSVFMVLNDILTEVAAIFPSEYIHIGGDECPKLGWKECPRCQERMKKEGLKTEQQLQAYFVTRIEKHVNSLGRKIIGWDEILEGGIAPSATVMSWQGETGGIAAANAGHHVIMAPAQSMYIDYYQGDKGVEPITIGHYVPLSKVYEYDPVPEAIDPDKRHYILGAQANLWGEYTTSEEKAEYMGWPRIAALAELDWTPKEMKDFDDFNRRLDNAMVRLDMRGIIYHIPLPEGMETDRLVYAGGDSYTLKFTNTRNYPMVYTLNSKNPTSRSKIYMDSIVIEGNKTVKIATMLPASGKLSPVRTVEVKKVAPNPAYEGETKPGFRYREATGYFADRSIYRNLNIETGVEMTSFREPSYDIDRPSIGFYEGYFEVDESGVYIFGSDMTELWIDGVMVIDNDGLLARHYNNKAAVALETGKHAYKFVFNNTVIDGWPKVWSPRGFVYKAPSSDKYVPVPQDKLSY